MRRLVPFILSFLLSFNFVSYADDLVPGSSLNLMLPDDYMLTGSAPNSGYTYTDPQYYKWANFESWSTSSINGLTLYNTVCCYDSSGSHVANSSLSLDAYNFVFNLPNYSFCDLLFRPNDYYSPQQYFNFVLKFGGAIDGIWLVSAEGIVCSPNLVNDAYITSYRGINYYGITCANINSTPVDPYSVLDYYVMVRVRRSVYPRLDIDLFDYQRPIFGSQSYNTVICDSLPLLTGIYSQGTTVRFQGYLISTFSHSSVRCFPLLTGISNQYNNIFTGFGLYNAVYQSDYEYNINFDFTNLANVTLTSRISSLGGTGSISRNLSAIGSASISFDNLSASGVASSLYDLVGIKTYNYSPFSFCYVSSNSTAVGVDPSDPSGEGSSGSDLGPAISGLNNTVNSGFRDVQSGIQSQTSQIQSAIQSQTNSLNQSIQSQTNTLQGAIQSQTSQLQGAIQSQTNDLNRVQESIADRQESVSESQHEEIINGYTVSSEDSSAANDLESNVDSYISAEDALEESVNSVDIESVFADADLSFAVEGFEFVNEWVSSIIESVGNFSAPFVVGCVVFLASCLLGLYRFGSRKDGN